MGKVVQRNQPCLNPQCGSSDARQVYEDGGSKCFSCDTSFRAPKVMTKKNDESSDEFEVTTTEKIKVKEPKDVSSELAEIRGYASRGFKERNITKIVCEHYGVKVSYNEAGEIDTHYYPYGDEKEGGFKVRKLPKIFSYIGKAGGLFGRNLFTGGGKRVIVTEGEVDTLSLAQAYYDKYKKFYPVVSVPSAAGTQQLLDNRDWLRSFQEVVLCFDNDEAGEVATAKAIKIIGIDKVKIVKFQSRKDANEVLLKDGPEALLRTIYDAERYSPAGIIGKDELFEQMMALNDVVAVPYPPCLEGINTKLKGMRLAEIALFISGTGSGKSTIIREIELHLLKETQDRIGIISLEETPGETARNMSAMALKKNSSEEEIPKDELAKGFQEVFGEDRVVVLDHQGSIKDSSIIEQLEYMALVGCKYLFIDHITILVSEGADGLTGNEAIDKIMNDLLRLCKKHNVYIGLVSHLRKAATGGQSFEEGKLPSVDDIRGSGSIKQVSMDIIAFARNMTAVEETERNIIKMTVLKCRRTGLTGPVAGAYYNRQTGRLGGADTIPSEEFTVL